MRHSAKSIIALILAFILCAGAFPFAALAEETEEPAEEERGSYSWYDPEADTLYISSIDELKEFTKLTRGDVTLDGTVIAKTDYAGKTVKLEADLDLEGAKWTGAEEDERAFDFAGIFDGQGHTIKNITFETHDDQGTGLFKSTVAGSVIKNLKLDGVTASLSKSYFGAIAGKLYGSVETCEAKNVEISTAASFTLTNAGGLSGYAYPGSAVKSSSVSSITIENANGGLQQVGGLSGSARGEVKGCTVTDAVFTAVTLYAVGGITGFDSGALIESCAVKPENNEHGAAFTGTSTTALSIRDVGGLVGYLRTGAGIKGSSVSGIKIESKGKTNGAGGFIGDTWYNSTTFSANSVTNVENCTATDIDIISAGYIDVAGGFAGVSNFIDFKNCTASNVSIESGGRLHSAAGFVGHTYYSNYSDSCSVSGVKIRGTSGTAYFDNIGGFVGYVTLSNFHDCTASGVDISASGRALYVGGFVGTVAANGYDPAKVTIERSTAAGTIELSAAEATSRGVGGFIGSLWNEGYTGFKWEGETTISGCTSNLDVNSVTTAGGFIGLAGGDYSSLAPENLIDAKLIVKNCRANGSVYSVSGTAGGFVGFGYRGTFENCVSNCEVG
ncbi:MAG: hypothetical protein IIT95_03775, partial [Oscillospiraceae bacterium]|nr:hypothetical protein [Oscillospiraceae bacterium]